MHNRSLKASTIDMFVQDFLAPELQKAGYTAIYKKKTTELYTRNA